MSLGSRFDDVAGRFSRLAAHYRGLADGERDPSMKALHLETAAAQQKAADDLRGVADDLTAGTHGSAT
jgi:hypothetical protein